MLASLYATGIVLISFAVIRLFPRQLISLFNQDPALIDFGSQALLTWFMFMPFIGFQIIASNYFQAIGQYRSAMFLTLTRQLIFLIPAIQIFPRIWRLTGLLHAAPFADLIATLLTGIWFYKNMKTLGRKMNDPLRHQFDYDNKAQPHLEGAETTISTSAISKIKTKLKALARS